MGYAISYSIKAVCFLVLILASTTSSQNTRCPFDLLYHLGDGVFDNGNAIANMRHGSRLPAAKLPYGNTHPGNPTGRWSDGLLDIDYGAQGLGFQEITAYLSENVSSANAIMFAVARSPVLDSTFFTSRGIRIPPYTVSLSAQMNWFKKYLSTICSTPADRANKLANALFLFGDVEANDITYSLIQGKSLQQVRSYIPYVTKAQISAAREVIRMGATRVILPGNGPLGCYPFILSELASVNPADYDVMGCLKSVNDLIILKNKDLQQAIEGLRKEFPSTFIMCPFDLLYHLGDGVFDNGNAIANMRHGSRLPAAKLPYGNTHPGNPTGRWSDGLLDIDYGAQGLGFQEITAYLSENVSSANAIMFAVARSPVLDSTFFTSRGIRIPPYTVSLSAQMNWFKKYLSTICSTPADRANKLANALFLFGDVEANDITYSLIQGKSLQQVRSYIPYVTKAQISAAREVIRMGATRVILPGNAPLGCYPFILSELASVNPADYDVMGCLKSVNDLIILKNKDLQQAIEGLRKEFPSTFIMCPFDLLYHLGDGVFDNGNAIANMRHGSRLPAAKLPYGNTHPGNPTGRWSDGLLDIDYGAQGLGFQEITAYLSENVSSANAIMFAVARSPVLDSTFFTSRGIRIPPYTVSLSAQMNWFKKYLSTICSTPADRANKLANALFLFGDVEANDITYSLIQGKSLQQVRSYIPYVTKAQISAAREVIRMGATRVILPGNGPLGCYPFILSELASVNPADYDVMGCLKSVKTLQYKHVVELEENITTIAEGSELRSKGYQERKKEKRPDLDPDLDLEDKTGAATPDGEGGGGHSSWREGGTKFVSSRA
ncbi:hypothetical protein RD792_014540 [Penstemon davidsonii]|uniref:GDSL esterase/lipase n=1 Tax=Penstemon davidsonii TaxID=160366 RepID=A0ABR0CPK6_9LAMI|nr:hypothetical protein RD792_014540 [Penstemon davidsonii]